MDRPIADIEYEQMLLSRYTIAQHRGDDGLDRSVYLLLSRIDADGPLSIGELSELFRLDASTLQRQTGAAMRADLLERIPDPAGGVARKFALTAHGRERLRASRARSLAALERILADWPDADVARFGELLRAFNHSIERYREGRAG
ncbi:MarR family winged helix-turn-helix transcriptional regulator [Leucobacter allii]|uniref:MarR family winged helix-turn-helix transcriptional regulator n=1 Tax=Leucobacter allii TaxID=2932247 RepID=A0ABY4FLH7_9MICO|nr:MarR family winged helix-turn-helix transcriptional regulator [Leucobacter allii]UOQ57132.1 MarR family winged helix-turn-helix transcriptional regulator [Leucobacter allii]